MDPSDSHLDDPRLADYRHLTDAAARRGIEGAEGEGIFVVEGTLALRQLLRSRHPVRSLVTTPTKAAAAAAELRDAGLDPHDPGFEHFVVERSALAEVAGFDVHRGVLAAADRIPLPDPAELLGSARRVVVAEALNDHENIGALFRNAAALGIDAVILDERTADPLYRRSIRVSAGWTMRLPYARADSAGQILDALARHGFTSIALTPGEGALDVATAAARGLLDDPVALLVGAEGPGLDPGTIDACDASVRVPMAGEVDSLNVATSLAVVASFAAARRGWRL